MESLRHGDQHALEPLEGIRGRNRKGRRPRCYRHARVDDFDAVRISDLGLVVVLLGFAGHSNDISQCHAVGAAVVDEDSVGGGRVSVTGVLDVEPPEIRPSAFVVANHDAFDRHGGSQAWRGGP